MVGTEWQRKQGPVEIRVMEEAAEVIHVMSKAIRFGWTDEHPIHHSRNRDMAVAEMADLIRVWNELAEKEGFPAYGIKEVQDGK